MEILNTYTNGNVDVTIYDNGTKIRSYEGKANPIHFESCDIKITGYCPGDRNGRICQFCHEMSDKNGKHADLSKLLEVLSVLPPGVELAVSGGDGLSHPNILSFLNSAKEKGWIVNITVNEKHVKAHQDQLKQLIQDKLIYGLGISYSSEEYLKDIQPLLALTDNIVFHLIMGINYVKDIDKLNKFCLDNSRTCKVLILGFKEFGNGKAYYQLHKFMIDKNKYSWFTQLAGYFKNENMVISFDNLAINQLNLKRYFTDEAWNKFFQGRDGQFSMYIDAVKQEYARSSTTAERVSFDDIDLLSFFKSLTND